MVRIVFGSMVAWVAGVVLSASAAAAASGRSWNFQADAIGPPPSGFTFGRTGEGPPGRWAVQLDESAPDGDHVLAQLDEDRTDYRFPVAAADEVALKAWRAPSPRPRFPDRSPPCR